MRVRDIMSSPAICCNPDACLEEPARQMWDRDCGLVVVTAASGQVLGVITDRDICMAVYTQGKAPRELRVADAMAKQVYTCRETDSVSRALYLMAQHQLRRLPVVNVHDRPTGVLSLNNLVRYFAASDDALREKVMHTMDAICQPRSADAPRKRRKVWHGWPIQGPPLPQGQAFGAVQRAAIPRRP